MLRRTVLIASIVGACAGCGWMIPDDRDVPDGVRDQFEEMTSGLPPVPGQQQCEVLLDRIRRVAIASSPAGGPDYAWYIAPTDTGGRWDWIVQVDEDGNDAGLGGGGGGGCVPPPGIKPDGLWWSGGGGSGAEVYHGGQLPRAPDRSDSRSVTTNPSACRSTRMVTSLSCWARARTVSGAFRASSKALDADGNVIASTDRPRG